MGLLLCSSFALVGVSEKADVQSVSKTLIFGTPTIQTRDDFHQIQVDGADAALNIPGKPMLPYTSLTMELPFGTKILDIDYDIIEGSTQPLEHKIQPGKQPIAQSINMLSTKSDLDQSFYSTNEDFPSSWITIHTGAGLNNEAKQRTFLIIHIYPLQYNPVQNLIHNINSITLTVTYQKNRENPFPILTSTDLVIIAPSKFQTALQKLIEHKNDHGIITVFKSLEEIYSEYDGNDEPEKIKYYLKDMKESDNITYALLVGGLKSYIYAKPRDDQNKGVEGWHVPVRYTNLRDSGGTYDPGFISDLYYADLYDAEGNFSSWDSDEDGIYAEWIGSQKDEIDLYPDIAIGRLACRNRIEVRIMVNKIIQYETTTAGSDWANTMILAGGDTHDDAGTNYVEGEEMTEFVLNEYMTDVDPVKLYSSNKDTDPDYTPTGTNLLREISKGAGLLFLTGHASPVTWTTHWIGEFEGPDSWTERFLINDFPKLSNRGKYPVCLVEGCHNSQFNVSMITTKQDTDNSKHMWTYGRMAPECWSWWLTRKIGGGSIATLGHTGLSYEATGNSGDLDGDGIDRPDCLEAYCGYQNRMYFKTLSEGTDSLGLVWSSTIESYLTTFPGMDNQLDAKTVEQWALLGDPTLKIGGYS
jgi:hypothetical protein